VKHDELICFKTINGIGYIYFIVAFNSTILGSSRNAHNTKQLVF